MATITEDQVLNIADMVRIAISNEEAQAFAKEISETLAVAKKLQEVETTNVEPTTHGIVEESVNVMRNDEAIQSITQEEALKNAPDVKDGHFKVPAIME